MDVFKFMVNDVIKFDAPVTISQRVYMYITADIVYYAVGRIWVVVYILTSDDSVLWFLLCNIKE